MGWGGVVCVVGCVCECGVCVCAVVCVGCGVCDVGE